MINAQLHDGTILQFPDDTSDEVVNRTVKNYLRTQADPYADERTVGGSVSEFGKGIARGFTSSFLSAGEGLAELADAATNYVGLDELIDSGEDNELVRLARQGKESLNSSGLGVDARYQDQWFTKFGEGLGSMASFFTPAGVVKGIGLAGKLATGTQLAGGLTLAGGVGAGEQAQRIQAARDQGIDVSQEDEDLSVLLGTGVGFTELAPVANILRKITRSAPKEFVDSIKNRLISASKSGGFEGLQEVSANIAQNAIERGVYNENLPIDKSLTNLLTSDEFTVGAASGFVIDLTLNSLGNRRNRFATESEKEAELEKRIKKEERIALGEEAVSNLQASEAQSLSQAEQGLNFDQSQSTVNPSEIDPPNPQQITRKTRRRNRYLEVIDSTNPDQAEQFQAEERVRRRKVKGQVIETAYIVDVNPDGTTQEKIISIDGVLQPNIQVQEIAPPSQNLQAVSQPNPPIDHANHIYAVMGRSFPTAGSFQVDMPADGSTESVTPNQVVHISPDGKKTPFGRNVQSFEEASVIAGRLNEKIIDSQVNNSVTQVINNSTESYSPEVKNTLVTYGDTILHPDEGTFTSSQIDLAAGTTIAEGFQENKSAKDLIADGTPRKQLTASQKINASRIAKGLPETNTFTAAEAKSVLRDNFGKLIRPPESLETAIYKTKKVKNKKTKKEEFVLVSENGDIIKDRPPTKQEADKQLSVTGGRRRKIKFDTRYQAQQYAKQLNSNKDLALASDPILDQGDKDAKLSVVKDALEKNNITNDINSIEVRTLAETFTGVNAKGKKKIQDMTSAELKALVSGIRSLPRFDSPTKLPLFKHNRYTPSQFGAALEFVKQNDNDTTNTMGIAQVIGLDPMNEPSALSVAQDLAADIEAHIAPLRLVPKPKQQEQEEILLLDSPAPTVDINKLTAIIKSRLSSFGLKDVGVNLDYALRTVSRNAEGQLVFGVRQGQRKDDSGELMFDSSGNPLMGAKREGVDERTEAFYSPDVNGIFLAVDTVSGIKDMTPEQQEAEFVRLLDHEMIHGMRQLDLWTEKEWQLLSSLANKRKSVKGGTFLENAQRNYNDQSKVVQMEEAVAEMTREARANQRLLTGKPRALTNRIKEFFTKTKNAINGFGFNSFDNIIKGIESGAIGSRERGQVRTLLETERELGTPIFGAPQTVRPPIIQSDRPEGEGQSLGDFEGVETIEDNIMSSRVDAPVSDSNNLAEFIKNNPEGFTVDPNTFETPSGVAVAPIKNLEIKVLPEEITEDVIDQAVDNFKLMADALDRKVYLGGWFNSEDGYYYLDGSITVDSEQEALYIAEAGDQLGIFNLNTFEETLTNDGIRNLKETGAYDNQAASIARRNKEKLDRVFGATRNEGQAKQEIVKDKSLSSRREADNFLSQGSTPRDSIPQIPEGAVEEAVKENIVKAKSMPSNQVPEFSVLAEPRSQYVAKNPDKGATLTIEDNTMYSRANQPEFSNKAQKEIDKLVTKSPNEPSGQAYLDVTSTGPIGEALIRFKAKAINKWARLEQVYTDPNLGFRDLLADSGALQASLFADKSRGITAEAIKNGVVVYKNGLTKVEKFIHNGKEYKGLIDVMAPLYAGGNQYRANLESLAQAYAVAKRSERLRLEGKAVPADMASLENLQEDVDKYIDQDGNKIIEQWFNAWQAYNAKTVQFLQSTGVLDSETAQLWMDQSDYIPFYRQAENPDLKDNMPKIFSGMTSAATFKELKGTETAVTVPLLEAITRNLDAAVSMGMKNVAQQRIVRDMVSLGLARETKDGSGSNVVRFRVNGKKRNFIIDDPLMFESMQAIGSSGTEQMITAVVGAPSKLLREMITRDPGFMMVNMLRDTLSTYVTSGANFVPVIDTVKNSLSGVDALSSYGVVGGYDFKNDPEDLFKFFQKEIDIRSGKNTNVIFKPFTTLWDTLGKATTASDAATRKAVFDDVLARTGNEAEAAFQALEVINFSRRGNSPLARMITAAIPFLNARFQGLDVFYRSARGRYGANKEMSKRKQQMIVAQRAAYLIGITGLYWMLVSDDEQYKEADEFTRDNNWLIPTPWDVPAKIPIPFEVGLMFKTLPERALALGFDKTTPREAAESALRATTSTLEINPFGAQIIAPLFEAGFNYNFYTGNPIVSPYVTKGMESAFQDRESTNELAKLVGQTFNISPLKVEHVMRGYTGTIGTYGMDAVDSIIRSPAFSGDSSLEMPSRTVFEYPIIKRFFANSKNSGAKEDFYELHSEIKKIVGTLNNLKKEGRVEEYQNYLVGREHLLGLRNNVNYVADRLSKIRKQRDSVMRSDLSPDEKREIIDRLVEAEKDFLKITSVLKRKAELPVVNTLYR